MGQEQELNRTYQKWVKNGGREGIRVVKSGITIGDKATQSTVRKEGKGTISAQVKGTVFVEGREECEENQPTKMGVGFPPIAMGWCDSELIALCFQGGWAVSPGAQMLSSEPGLQGVWEERYDRQLG